MNQILLCCCFEFAGDNPDCPQHGEAYRRNQKDAHQPATHVCPWCLNTGEGSLISVNNHVVLSSHTSCVDHAQKA